MSLKYKYPYNIEQRAILAKGPASAIATVILSRMNIEHDTKKREGIFIEIYVNGRARV